MDPTAMLGVLDVAYASDRAVAACIVATSWAAPTPTFQQTATIMEPAPYVPGEFYRRELPCLLTVLSGLEREPEILIIDGFVWLEDPRGPGLGAHLHQALAGRTPVIGVSKNPFHRGRPAREILRGTSRKPLFVSAVGIDLDRAAERIVSMAGTHRIPTLLAAADRAARRGLVENRAPERTSSSG